MMAEIEDHPSQKCSPLRPVPLICIFLTTLLCFMHVSPIARRQDDLNMEASFPLFRGSGRPPLVDDVQRLEEEKDIATSENYISSDKGIPVWRNYQYDPKKVLVLQFSDEEHAGKYSAQFRTMQCYSHLHGYDHEVVDPNRVEDCKRLKGDFFHKQLCALHAIMSNSPQYEYFVKVDGDVIGGTSDRSLEHWLEDGADMVLFERYYTAEFNAGFYALRNTAAARNLVWNWSQFWWKDPMMGFSGADNGSIHLAVLDALQITGRHQCWNKFRSSLNGSLASYFEVVACARGLIGPPRRHHRNDPRDMNGEVNITIWPAVYGPMIDVMLVGEVLLNRLEYPLHHGVKDATGPMITNGYGPTDSLGVPDAHDGKCVKYDPDKALTPIWDSLLAKATKWTKPRPDSVDIGGHPTRCFDAPGPPYHWRVPRYNIDGLPASCKDGYGECQPLGPRDIFEYHGYRCTGALSDKAEDTPMSLVKLPKPHPHYDELILNELSVSWQDDVPYDQEAPMKRDTAMLRRLAVDF